MSTKSDPGLESGRMSTGSLRKCSGFITMSASVMSPSFVQDYKSTGDCRRNAKKSEIPYKPIPQCCAGNGKEIQNPHAAPVQHQKLVTSRRSTRVHAYRVWSTSVTAFASHPGHRMKDRQTDSNNHITLTALVE